MRSIFKARDDGIAAAARKAARDEDAGIPVFVAVYELQPRSGVEAGLAECIADVEAAGWELDAMTNVAGATPQVLLVFRRITRSP